MVTKNENGSYNIEVSLDDGDFDLPSGKSVIGNFKFEIFEKNLGTFDEDIIMKENLEVEDLFIDNKSVKWNNLNTIDRAKILSYVTKDANEQLKKYQYGEN